MSEKTMDRAEALAILHEYVKDPGLRRHMLAAEAAMRGYAARLGHDPEPWGLAGLLHDFDWEIHPTIEQHPKDGAPILRARGLGEESIKAILAHNPAGTGVPQEAPIDFALMACDEITGLIIAATLVRPAKDINQMTVKSVQRNWKDKLFCAAVDRHEIEHATANFSQACFEGRLELWQHVGNVLESMQQIAADLELDGRFARPPAS
jgi:putative nucleotidyltransferase with HDIG domain